MTVNKYEFKDFDHEEPVFDEKQAFFLCWLSQNLDKFGDQTVNQVMDYFDTWVWAVQNGGVLH